MAQTRKMVIDTDTASDDAVALVMALREPEIEVVAITVVAGNVSTAQGSLNARHTVGLCGKQVPVYEGAIAPLTREAHRATFFHGEDGMGNMNLPPPTTRPAAGHAVDALIETIRTHPGIMLVTLGPLTNVALAVCQAPEIARHVSRCVVMGGAAGAVGNVTPAAEFNIWCDPEAARICFRSGLPIEMVGWELSRGEANLSEEEARYCKEVINTPLSHFAVDCNTMALEANRALFGEPGIPLPDPIAMAIAIDPTICTESRKHYVEVECDGAFTRGMTVVDQLGIAPSGTANVAMWRPLIERGEPHVTVCWRIDVKRWKELLYRLLR